MKQRFMCYKFLVPLMFYILFAKNLWCSTFCLPKIVSYKLSSKYTNFFLNFSQQQEVKADWHMAPSFILLCLLKCVTHFKFLICSTICLWPRNSKWPVSQILVNILHTTLPTWTLTDKRKITLLTFILVKILLNGNQL